MPQWEIPLENVDGHDTASVALCHTKIEESEVSNDRALGVTVPVVIAAAVVAVVVAAASAASALAPDDYGRLVMIKVVPEGAVVSLSVRGSVVQSMALRPGTYRITVEEVR